MSEVTEHGTGPRAGELVFADGLASLARAIQENLSDDVHSLDFIVTAAIELIPGVESASVSTLASKTRLAAESFSGSLAQPMLDAQNLTGEGPCLNVAAGADQILVPDLTEDRRWPAFAAAIVPAGVRSVLCTPLSGDGSIQGSLSLHSTAPGVFTDESRELARVFAAHASIAMAGDARHRGIVAALGSRDIIGQAKGILMERFSITADAAFFVLLRMSQHLNVKLRAVSEELCSTGVLPGTRSTSRGRGTTVVPVVVRDAVARTGGATSGPAAAAPEVDGVAVEAIVTGSVDEDVITEAVLSGPAGVADAARSTSR